MDDPHSQASELMGRRSINDDAILDHSRLRVQRKYNTEEWKAKKPFIKEFYVDNNGTLNDLMKALSENYNFHPTRKMYKDKFQQWGFAKNITKKNVQGLLGHETPPNPTRSVSTLGIYGRPVERERLAKFLKRKKLSPADSLPVDDGPAEVDHAAQMNNASTTSIAAECALDSFGTYPNQHNTTSVDSCYEQACHYRPWKKKFRLVETFPDGETYIGDSFGYHSYIDVNQERSCTSLCFCRKHSISKAFTFVVYKLSDQMSISINSNALYAELIALIPLDDISLQLCFPERRINGLELLKHYQTLTRRLKDLQSDLHHNPTTQDLVLEFGLLVDGLLRDGQVFKSFSYEKLYESGFLDYQLYKYFQQQQCDKDITVLDDGFCNIDDEEGTLMAESSSTSTTLDQERKMDGPTHNWNEFAVEIANDPDQSSLQKATYHSIGCSSEALHHVDDLHKQESCLDHDNARSQLFTVTQHSDGSTLQSLLNCISDVDRVERSTAHLSGTVSLSESASPLPKRINQLFVNYEVVDPNKKGLYWLLAITSKAGREGIAQWLLNCIVDPNRESYDLLSASAFRVGREGNAQRLSYYNTDVNGGTFDLPLASAARAGLKEIVQLLLDRGADPNGNSFITPLVSASSAGHERIVKLLLDRGADPNGNSFITPLVSASSAGHERIVKLLLDRGADPNGNFFNAPLVNASSAGHERIVKLLLDRGADLNGGNFSTPLIKASLAGHEGIVKLLLDRGADPNRWELKEDPLSGAVIRGHEGIVKLLLDRGADPNRWELKEYPLSGAVIRGHEGIVKLLLDRGADPNNWEYSESPLSDAAIGGHEGIVKLLLEHGTKLSKKRLYSPKYTAGVGSQRTAEPLPNYRSDLGQDYFHSLLTSAARAGDEKVMKLLLDNGADINAISSDGLALSIAVESRKATTVKLLIKEGANLQLAALYLQDREDKRWLFAAASGTWSQQTTNSSKSEKLRYLRLKFINQYMMLAKVARNSFTKLRGLPTRFRNFKETWKAGIGTLRGLRRGDTPRDVYETIAFLLIARAIVETLRDKKNCDYFEEFQQDLHRWAVLFKDIADFEAYREAVTSIWDVVFGMYPSSQREDAEALLRFQELASTLLSRANDLLDFDAFDNGGLEHSQRKWRENTGQPQCANIPNSLSKCQIPRTTDPPPQEVIPPLPPDPPFLPSTSTLEARIKADPSPFEPVVVFLMAGAIFAIMIIFLQVLRQISTSFTFCSVKTYQDRYWILATYIGLYETTIPTLSPIMLENDLFMGYDSFVY